MSTEASDPATSPTDATVITESNTSTVELTTPTGSDIPTSSWSTQSTAGPPLSCSSNTGAVLGGLFGLLILVILAINLTLFLQKKQWYRKRLKSTKKRCSSWFRTSRETLRGGGVTLRVRFTNWRDRLTTQMRRTSKPTASVAGDVSIEDLHQTNRAQKNNDHCRSESCDKDFETSEAYDDDDISVIYATVQKNERTSDTPTTHVAVMHEDSISNRSSTLSSSDVPEEGIYSILEVFNQSQQNQGKPRGMCEVYAANHHSSM